MNRKTILILAASTGILAVGLGAFGAHALKPMLMASARLDTYQTAVGYQFYHVFALLATGILMKEFDQKKLGLAGLCFTLGIVLFSGSLYVICFTGITSFGLVTPFGGVLFIAGWIFMLSSFLKK
ncbi:MAG: DUF423 domain-containing protein [Cyclobacteriaceae bacterium]|nr:DUF423 domain-containing protein [Cyclobacteriaceae bacterium]